MASKEVAPATTGNAIGMVVIRLVVAVVVRVVVGVVVRANMAASSPPHRQHTFRVVLQGAVQVVSSIDTHHGHRGPCCVRRVVAEAIRAAHSARTVHAPHLLTLLVPPSCQSLRLVLETFGDFLAKLASRSFICVNATTGAALAVPTICEVAAARRRDGGRDPGGDDLGDVFAVALGTTGFWATLPRREVGSLLPPQMCWKKLTTIRSVKARRGAAAISWLPQQGQNEGGKVQKRNT
eukprot:CAMPEP_0206577058 /NCGR_PEP_ID=MMETSP0325_2-20121206/31125_1 /ASSEMBLY_ACC=CAM_ASM_000347 /TAXON_ID=2866 /ORGANISM="Crypthecodinium cohnii, Strain Seligo" /LENGTH=236 /DNA_ID=CAMNT_0054082401 /DNA_START=329 /DNA_END=1040 /DNA_ORIENTATION=+